MSDNEIRKTLKSADTEEFLDIIFYRKLGYQVAKFSARHGIRPNTITIISIFWGVLAGHLYYYNHFWINLAGVFSLMIANTLDSADGQLARMTTIKPDWDESSMDWPVIYGLSVYMFTLLFGC